jgi:hypothetical protein
MVPIVTSCISIVASFGNFMLSSKNAVPAVSNSQIAKQRETTVLTCHDIWSWCRLFVRSCTR